MRATPRADADVLATRYGAGAFVFLVLAVFLGLRLGLLFVRDPFYDELFTQWIVAKSFGGIVDALRYDSGPPLYYFVARALGLRTVLAFRLLSLGCATAAMLLVAWPVWRGTPARRGAGLRRTLAPEEVAARAPRLVAISLLAVYPPAVLFAVDGRAYAMAAMFIAAALLAIEKRRPFLAAILLVFGAYAHFYGVLFFPLLLITETRNAFRAAALGLAVVLFGPGFWLAAQQPRAAIRWMDADRLSALWNLSFAGRYPGSLFHRQPQALSAIAWIAVASALVLPLIRDVEVRRHVRLFAIATIGPLLLAVAAGVYFPMRFESVIAVPLTLWIGLSVEHFEPWKRRALILLMVVIGLAVNARGIVDHAERPRDDYREAARWVAANVSKREKVVAAGYLYLETIATGRKDALAFPPSQAIHPGWRALPEKGERAPSGRFIWIGERRTPDESAALRGRRVQVLFANERALVTRVE